MKIFRNVKINGNQLSKKIQSEIKNNIQAFMAQNKLQKRQIKKPKLQIINIGHNIGSVSYILKKMQIAETVGIQYNLHQFLVKSNNFAEQYKEVQGMLGRIQKHKFKRYEMQKQTQRSKNNFQKKISQLIDTFNQDQETSAILLQLPLHQNLINSTQDLINRISPQKDADCLTLTNRLKILDHTKIPKILPCTPQGILRILDEYKINIEGMNAVMIGRSNLVGKPLSHLLLNRNATVTTCQHYTKDVNFYTKNADLVISATGVSHLVKQVKQGAILIDVGISRSHDGKLSGDICIQAKKKANFYTPVPGGVGPLTVIMLMQNVYKLWKASHQNKNLFQD